jgi:hypothetical protein
MSDQSFDKPILNSPYVVPGQHWEMDKEGQPTQRVTITRRTAEYVSPIPKLKERKGADRAAELRADYILANPPFNISDWGGQLLRDSRRRADGDPPFGKADYAWIQLRTTITHER